MNHKTFTTTIKNVAAIFISTAIAIPINGTAIAQTKEWPQKPVRLIVAFGPGGAVDTIGRDIAKELSDLWGQPVLIDNKPGAGGIIAADATAKASPDGYTLFLATDGINVVVPFMKTKLPYDTLADLQPISLVGSIPLILVSTPESNIKNINDFVAKARNKPGSIDYASNGVGVSPHMAMESFQRTAKIKVNHITYKGSVLAMQDMLGGRIPIMWGAVSSTSPHIQSGKLIPVAIGSLERSPLLPDVPTVSESGFSGFEAGTWVGIIGPSKMPPSLIQKIQTDLQKVTANPSYRKQQASKGNEVRSSTSLEFSERIRAEYSRNKMLFESGVIPRE
jgi:tripartite-type tricarboxylate transporter receptor subunit TctC